jgi:hypothetical protein
MLILPCEKKKKANFIKKKHIYADLIFYFQFNLIKKLCVCVKAYFGHLHALKQF